MTCTEMSDISHCLFSAVLASVGSRMQMVGAVPALLGKEQVVPAVREEELELSSGCSYSASRGSDMDHPCWTPPETRLWVVAAGGAVLRVCPSSLRAQVSHTGAVTP